MSNTSTRYQQIETISMQSYGHMHLKDLLGSIKRVGYFK